MREKFRRPAAAAVVLTLAIAPAAETAAETAAGGCVLRSIELDDRSRETRVRLLTDGEPASIGARVESGDGVVLDLAGCASRPELSDREFAAGLVSALRLDRGSSAKTAVAVRVRGAFEYSVSSQTDAVLVRLLASDSGVSPRVQVLEPLPAAPPPVAPLPPIAEEPPPSPEPAPAPAAQRSPSPATSTSGPAPDPGTSVIAEAVRDWARAWQAQKSGDYLSAYSPSFRPPRGLSRPAWETQRQQRIDGAQWIEVTLDDLEVRLIEPGRALAVFFQRYRSDSYSDEVEKALLLVLEDGHWRIQREEIGRVEDPAVAPQAPLRSTSSRETLRSEPSPIQPRTAAALVDGARISVDKAPAYDASYRVIPYPGGDPGWERGSGVDVVVRAYRHFGVDLQKEIHEDLLIAAADYGVRQPDPRIDHRRIRNLWTFMRRHGLELGIEPAADWRPGDLVFWAVGDSRAPNHLGIVSDRRSPDDHPLVIHHLAGATPSEDDRLFAWPIHGHYRWLPEADPQ